MLMRGRGGNPATGADRRDAGRYALAVLIFGLLAASAVGLFRQDALGLAVPTVITGVVGAAGAAVVGVAAHRRPDARVQRTARVVMTIAAGAVAVTGVVLAPKGMDRGFVIGVAALLAVLLAAFALFAGPSRRPG
jgi:peptidoglycan/LPS O-acetylase OafA/YrhL